MTAQLIEGFDMANTDQDNIVIDSFMFAPGEAKGITQLISIAGSMHQLKALPPNIKSRGETFIIEFSEDGTLRLSRNESPNTIVFSFDKTDDLIVAINEGVKMCLDKRLLSPKPRAGYAMDILPGGGGDIF